MEELRKDHVFPTSLLKWIMLSLSLSFRKYPKQFFKIVLSYLIPIALIVLVYRHYKQHCLFHGGLRPH